MVDFMTCMRRTGWMEEMGGRKIGKKVNSSEIYRGLSGTYVSTQS